MTSDTYNYGVIAYTVKASAAFPTGTTILGSLLYKSSTNTQNISLYISMSASGAAGVIQPPLTGNLFLQMGSGGAAWRLQKVSTITLTPIPIPPIIPINSTYLGANIKYLSDKAFL